MPTASVGMAPFFIVYLEQLIGHAGVVTVCGPGKSVILSEAKNLADAAKTEKILRFAQNDDSL